MAKINELPAPIRKTVIYFGVIVPLTAIVWIIRPVLSFSVIDAYFSFVIPISFLGYLYVTWGARAVGYFVVLAFFYSLFA